jgi:hypothetical protein
MQSPQWIWAELPNYKPLTANTADKTSSAHSSACIIEQGRWQCSCLWCRRQESMLNFSVISAQTVIENLTVNSEELKWQHSFQNTVQPLNVKEVLTENWWQKGRFSSEIHGESFRMQFMLSVLIYNWLAAAMERLWPPNVIHIYSANNRGSELKLPSVILNFTWTGMRNEPLCLCLMRNKNSVTKTNK